VTEAAAGEQIGAAVDLGSTSVHLLVARIVEHRVEPLIDESLFLGLGAAVEAAGFLGAAGRKGLAAALAEYGRRTRDAGAGAITFVGTEPLRRLADAARIVTEVEAASGVPVHVLSHEEEGFLTLVGVTEGRPVEHDVLVGAARLVRGHVSSDPPTLGELAALRAAAAQAVATAPISRPAEVILVGGTASNLLKIVPNGRLTRRLTTADLSTAFDVVAGHSSAALVERFLVRPARARILGAGAAIVEAIMQRYGVEEIRVADGGVREGTVVAVAHAGGSWRDRLEELAHGWVV
jgi:exopolyphosphatase/guanosine-5'-triphosphate,3'-diphosphate pyrophosphatase